jgi:hypothetical protein
MNIQLQVQLRLPRIAIPPSDLEQVKLPRETICECMCPVIPFPTNEADLFLLWRAASTDYTLLLSIARHNSLNTPFKTQQQRMR